MSQRARPRWRRSRRASGRSSAVEAKTEVDATSILPSSNGKTARLCRGMVPFTHLAREGRMAVTIGRRELLAALGGAAAWPLAARAQQGERMRRVGVLMGYAEADPAAQTQVVALRQELQKLGWDDGRNIRIDVRFPGTDAGRARAILMELISLTPDVLVSNTNLVTEVVQAEVRTLPIVFTSVGDPVGSGFVNNEARPNGNLTGFANWDMSMSGKWLELLKE